MTVTILLFIFAMLAVITEAKKKTTLCYLRRKTIAIYLHKGDLSKEVSLQGDVAIDTETMGLNPHRDRLCLFQISDGKGDAHLVQFEINKYEAPRLKAILLDKARTKIFHFARFDVAVINKYLNINMEGPFFCTKIASKLSRTYTDKHGLKDLCKELLNIELSKQQQSSFWGAAELSQDQQKYAASDVLYLHQLRDKLADMLAQAGRLDIAEECFRFLPTRTTLDLIGWPEKDIFSHES